MILAVIWLVERDVDVVMDEVYLQITAGLYCIVFWWRRWGSGRAETWTARFARKLVPPSYEYLLPASANDI